MSGYFGSWRAVRAVPRPWMLASLLLVLVVSATSLIRAAPKKPPSPPPPSPSQNILLILVDDLGIEHLDFYGLGAQFSPTPNLTQLASTGLMFVDAWSNPICSPTRAAIQTGRYAFRTGIGSNTFRTTGETQRGLPIEELILPELLKFHAATTYSSALFGKWHLGADEDSGGQLAPNLAGYDHFEGVLASADLIDENGIREDIYSNYPKTINGATFEVVDGYSTTDIIDSAIAWINASSDPWLATVAPLAPHLPFHWPPAHLHTQDTSQEGDLARYRAMIEALDMEIGRLLESINTENTLIIFASDNGSPAEVALPPVLPQRAKGTLFQGGVRVPLVIAGEGIIPGQVNGLVNLSDLFATIADVAGATIPDDIVIDSVSLVPYFSQPGRASLRSHAFSELFYPNGDGPHSSGAHAARNERYKFGRTSAGGEMMVDLWTDPWESWNLLQDPLSSEQQEAYDELTGYMVDLLGVCTLSKQGEACVENDDCCSGVCRGRRGRKVCRDLQF